MDRFIDFIESNPEVFAAAPDACTGTRASGGCRPGNRARGAGPGAPGRRGVHAAIAASPPIPRIVAKPPTRTH